MLPDMKMNRKPSITGSFGLGISEWLCKSQSLPSSAVIVSEAVVQHQVPSAPISPFSHVTLSLLRGSSALIFFMSPLPPPPDCDIPLLR